VVLLEVEVCNFRCSTGFENTLGGNSLMQAQKARRSNSQADDVAVEKRKYQDHPLAAGSSPDISRWFEESMELL
jgi:hypothetical protein